MTVTELVERLQAQLAHGMAPDTMVLSWDPDEEAEVPVTGLIYWPDTKHVAPVTCEVPGPVLTFETKEP